MKTEVEKKQASQREEERDKVLSTLLSLWTQPYWQCKQLESSIIQIFFFFFFFFCFCLS